MDRIDAFAAAGVGPAAQPQAGTPAAGRLRSVDDGGAEQLRPALPPARAGAAGRTLPDWALPSRRRLGGRQDPVQVVTEHREGSLEELGGTCDAVLQDRANAAHAPSHKLIPTRVRQKVQQPLRPRPTATTPRHTAGEPGGTSATVPPVRAHSLDARQGPRSPVANRQPGPFPFLGRVVGERRRASCVPDSSSASAGRTFLICVVDALYVAGTDRVSLATIAGSQRRFAVFLWEDPMRCIACMG
ncbi:hypothetical protein QFZ82_005509 [Streptomyces sp. V4I23]|nr:hypothetical protein [Streptomyces sp. V4I23]